MSERLEFAGSDQAGENGKPPVWVAIYCRKSNDENLNGLVTSLDNQKAACRSYLQIQREKNWREFPETFDDPAESGKDLKRPAMQRLLKRIEEGGINAVIVYKLDRLTRSSKDFNHLLEFFEERSIAFVSATESIDTRSPQGRLMTSILIQFAQYDRELDVERSKDFHLARARKGLWCAGLPPLGYDLKDKQLVVNEPEAELVRRIFDLYLHCGSAIRAAEEMNRLGFRRKSYRTADGRPWGGKPFDMQSVLRILQRKVYVGLITNERSGQEFPGQHQPIVPRAIFEQAQELMKSHLTTDGKSRDGANKYGFRLKGLVRCGECGSAVTSYIRPKAKSGKVYLYYRCLAKAKGLPIRCKVTSVGAQKLEEFVVEKLAALGWDRALLEKVIEKVNALTKTRVGPLGKEKAELEAQLQKIRGESQTLIGLAKTQKDPSAELAEELARLGSARKALETKIAEIAAQVGHRGGAVYDADVIQRALQSFARFIYRLPIERQVGILRLVVRRVLLFKDGVKVELHELPIADLQRALDGKDTIKGGGQKVQIPLLPKGESLRPTNSGRVLAKTGGVDGI